MITYLYDRTTGNLLSPIMGSFSLQVDDLPEGVGICPVPEGQDITGCIVDLHTATLVMPDDATKASTALQNSKEDALRHIDRKAGSVRSLWVSDGVGQQMVYKAKEEEASSYLADDSPVAVNYPHLVAEIGITGDDLMAVANTIKAKAQDWLQVSAEIEAIRLSTKNAVRAATTPEEIQTIIKQVKWPIP